jgi:2-iminobutanoate/2-iminopropanoate deaminase
MKANGFIYLSGYCGLTPDAKLVGEGDMKKQTDQVIKNLRVILEQEGSSLNKIVKTNIFITDMSRYKELNEVYSQYFTTHKPARSCVEVKSLPVPNAIVEIEAVALE